MAIGGDYATGEARGQRYEPAQLEWESASPAFLGAATLGGDRLDVAAAFGATARFSGYGLRVGGLATGTYDIAVFPHSAVTNTFVAAKIVRVTIAR